MTFLFASLDKPALPKWSIIESDPTGANILSFLLSVDKTEKQEGKKWKSFPTECISIHL